MSLLQMIMMVRFCLTFCRSFCHQNISARNRHTRWVSERSAVRNGLMVMRLSASHNCQTSSPFKTGVTDRRWSMILPPHGLLYTLVYSETHSGSLLSRDFSFVFFLKNGKPDLIPVNDTFPKTCGSKHFQNIEGYFSFCHPSTMAPTQWINPTCVGAYIVYSKLLLWQRRLNGSFCSFATLLKVSSKKLLQQRCLRLITDV